MNDLMNFIIRILRHIITTSDSVVASSGNYEIHSINL